GRAASRVATPRSNAEEPQLIRQPSRVRNAVVHTPSHAAPL
uniref:Uncharacterized protein n=1 Tax=Cucumis melo TaxID=3656 RepID=A0A9I9E436_CUCME